MSPKRLFTGLVLIGAVTAQAAALGDEGETKDRIIEGLEKNLPSLTVERDQLSRSPIPGLWTLQVGPDVVYVDESGEHLVQGDVISLRDRENLTETDRRSARLEAIDAIPSDRKISYPAEDEEHSITVFTDIDCGYCRQLHRDMADLNEAGVTVDYLFFPRGGQSSDAWEKSNRVWCADDRRAALDQAKSGQTPETASCDDTPTEMHHTLGQRMGVTGTPAIITDEGHMIRGYMPLPRLLQQLEGGGNQPVPARQSSR